MQLRLHSLPMPSRGPGIQLKGTFFSMNNLKSVFPSCISLVQFRSQSPIISGITDLVCYSTIQHKYRNNHTPGTGRVQRDREGDSPQHTVSVTYATPFRASSMRVALNSAQDHRGEQPDMSPSCPTLSLLQS